MGGLSGRHQFLVKQVFMGSMEMDLFLLLIQETQHAFDSVQLLMNLRQGELMGQYEFGTIVGYSSQKKFGRVGVMTLRGAQPAVK
jgi:hypothetical protein